LPFYCDVNFPMKRPPDPSADSHSAIKSQLLSIVFTSSSFIHLPFYGRPLSYPISQARFDSQLSRDGLNHALNPCEADLLSPSRYAIILRIYGVSNGPSRRLLLRLVDLSSANPSLPLPGEGDCPFVVFFIDLIYFPSRSSNIASLLANLIRFGLVMENLENIWP